MRAKTVFESMSEDAHEERMRRRREEDDRESREIRKSTSDDLPIIKKRTEPEEAPRYASRLGDDSDYYERDENGRIKRIIDSKERNKAKKKEEAMGRLMASQALILMVDPNPKGVKELEDFQWEDGEPIDPDDWVLRTQLGDGPMIAYSKDVDKEHFTSIENRLKTDYKDANDMEYNAVRPITYKNWLEKDYEGKISTLKDGKTRTYKKKEYENQIGRDD